MKGSGLISTLSMCVINRLGNVTILADVPSETGTHLGFTESP